MFALLIWFCGSHDKIRSENQMCEIVENVLKIAPHYRRSSLVVRTMLNCNPLPNILFTFLFNHTHWNECANTKTFRTNYNTWTFRRTDKKPKYKWKRIRQLVQRILYMCLFVYICFGTWSTRWFSTLSYIIYDKAQWMNWNLYIMLIISCEETNVNDTDDIEMFGNWNEMRKLMD